MHHGKGGLVTVTKELGWELPSQGQGHGEKA